MLACHSRLALVLAGCVYFVPSTALAAPPWKSLIPFKKVEADPDKSYAIAEENGPWTILAASFAGEDAELQASELVLELRRDFNLPAYLHRQTFDFTEPVVGKGFDPQLRPLKMRHHQNYRFDEFAVLVGDFESVEDPRIERVLAKVRHANPACLDFTAGKGTNRRFAGLREIMRISSTDSERRRRGPMGNSFVTRNPLLPDEFFVSKGLDPLVLDMNKGVKHSLLDNPGRYTVKVATFRGKATMKLDEIERLKRGGKMESKLEEAAIQAHDLTVILRRRGIEAYEYHDRFESIVTVGSFESPGHELPDRIVISPEVHEVMKQFGGQEQQIPGFVTPRLVPQTIEGITLDLQPIPMEVPQRSLGATYARDHS